MKKISKKVRPVLSISVDDQGKDWKAQIHLNEEPFIFLKKDRSIFAYVNLKNLANGDPSHLSLRMLNDHAIAIDNIAVLTKEKTISLPLIFQILGSPISLVADDKNELTGYVKREDALVELFKRENQNINLLKTMLTSIPMGIFVIDSDQKIINFNESGLNMIKSSSQQIKHASAHSIFNKDHIETVLNTGKTLLNQVHVTEHVGILVDYSPIISPEGKVDGLIVIVQDLPMVEDMAMEIEYVKDLNRDLNAILSTIYDEILVVNNKGELLRYSEHIIPEFWESDLKGYVGKNILELEREGNFNPSVARLVLEQKKKVSVVQETRHGKKVLAVGNPVFDDDGDIHRIVIASRDITETTELKTKLKEMQKISNKYKEELESFKSHDEALKKIIYCSPKMEKLMAQVKKVSDFSSTVLILGESGVGKELIAESIHKLGQRAHHPFLKINCGAIPENLLESELFGYIKGAFTGANANGKTGYFQKADKGVLFLDEVSEMPLQLQVKLLRVLQEKEVVPIGSTSPVNIDLQIIAATNRHLEDMVKQGTFREDLFYRLNVIPMKVPPLRERPEDVPLLAFHFLQELNERYHKDCHFSPDGLDLLEVHSWPGNIRELQNLVERLFVTTEDETINAEFVSRFIKIKTKGYKKPIITDIYPLQEAQDCVEEQLILLAMKKYKTTTKAAKALGISQSSVSRKYQKALKREESAMISES
ncbi:transcriptional regulator with PAS, ATPase and Fis domain [Scopulibacillus darangshiensis]|uniref:HTH-type transcriptional regulatory protein TyrR n=1 Tax=Scopulibacillus darangshiensis TaxID=442528 RepID=A0A4R2P6T8_9BACL|nr:sigma 54-interacting transcriptional regulator [Scopulibacillus darangshiensis]TCP30620.1 transcriptional regulator with PAS, ATPase and Fis domain [Scopulibacillus darangshiensis]